MGYADLAGNARLSFDQVFIETRSPENPLVPKDEGVLRPQQTVQGFPLVSDVQFYLDLQRVGLRAEEQAEELKHWPDFAGGWE